MQTIYLPENVKYIIKELETAGYEAYAVGGCVRDSIIGRIPGDWDITTSALPHEVKEIFGHTVDTGIEHGTVTVKIKTNEEISAYEVTTYRVDGEYEDMRHPKAVSFTRSLEEDLKRRDFTINAMAYNDTAGLIDLFDGMGDLDRKIIGCVGSADERFEEDALRMLRAVRFAAQLDFEIEEKTKEAIRSHAKNLSAISKERIYTEITKLICSAHIDHIYAVNELGLSKYCAEGLKEAVFEGLSDLRINHTVSVSDRYIRYAYLFAGQSRDTVKKILRQLKSDNDTVDKASKLASEVFKPLPNDRYELKTRMSEFSKELFCDLLEMKSVFAKSAQANLQSIIELHRDILNKGEPVYLKDLAVSGTDLIEAGMEKGPKIGEVLNILMDIVRKNPEYNEKQLLLEKAKAYTTAMK